MRRDVRVAGGTDEGFTLIEVIVALVLLAIVATAALYFFIEGTRTTSHLQRTQNAVAVANEAMERAYAVQPKDSLAVTGTPTIVVGRTQASVNAAWSSVAGLGIEGVAETYPLWDSTATASSTPVLPVVYDSTHSGETYTVTLLVGTCFRNSSATTTDQVCTKLSGVPADPGDALTPANSVRMLRIIAIVTWEPSAGKCGGSLCSYQLSGLMDRSDDLKWNQVFIPVAADDYATVDHGQVLGINVMMNDLIGPVRTSPVQIVAAPAAGQGSAVAATNGTVTYTAPTAGSGIFEFTYRLRDARGAWSSPATVFITLAPKSANDTATALSGGPTTIPVTANDIGSPTPAGMTFVSGPHNGTATFSGLNIVYTPSVEFGTDSLQYRYTDGSGQASPVATVTILIDSLKTQDRAVDRIAWDNAAFEPTPLRDILIAGNTNPSDIRITIVGPKPTAGKLSVDGVAYNKTLATDTSAAGTLIAFSPPRNTIGEYTFQFRLSRVSTGTVSAVQTATIRVLPTATADVFTTVLGDNGLKDITNVVSGVTVTSGSNDLPKYFAAANNVTVTLADLSAGCGSFPATQGKLTSGILQVNLPNVNNAAGTRNCTFQYTLQGSGTFSALKSGPVTVSFSFKNQ